MHVREEARFTLHLLDDPRAALRLAQENWQVQREPADIRILFECARAAGDTASVETARAWLTATGLEDGRLEKYFRESAKPN